MKPNEFLWVFALIAAVLLPGCASVTVKDVERNGKHHEIQRPVVLVVENFHVDPANVKENPRRKHPGKLADDSQRLLHGFLVEELKKTGVPVVSRGHRTDGDN